MKTYTTLGTCSKFTIGADPEIFVQKDGRITGAEKVIPKDGIKAGGNYDTRGKIIIDGVAAEINPAPSYCRGIFGGNVSSCIVALYKQLEKNGFKMSESGTVTVPKDELESLAKENQRLGCGPSENFYDSTAKVIVTKDNKHTRSAGGHIHMQAKPEPNVVVPLFDLFVGNTLVLIDRDPDQAVRRQQYGRAGEYRLPKHGIEYRTPSNFWLRSYQLMGLTTNLCRLALRVAMGRMAVEDPMQRGIPEKDCMEWLTAHVDQAMVQKAINENDFDLAYANWQLFREFIELFVPRQKNTDVAHLNSGVFSLWPGMLDEFEFFVEKGIDHWWKEKDIYKQWEGLDNAASPNYFPSHGMNWEGWFVSKVIPEYKKHKETK